MAETSSLYTEAEPLGPTDAGDAGGGAQLSLAYCRRFVRKLSDGKHYGVVDIECMVVDLNDGNPDAPVRPVLSRSFGFTVCTDPDDPGMSEVQSYSAYAPDEERGKGEPPYTDADVFAACAAFDPAVLTWDGEPVEGTDYPH